MEDDILHDEPLVPPSGTENTTNHEMMAIMADLSQNMAVMSESLKRIHKERDEAEPAVRKKSRTSPESGLSNEVAALLNEGETGGKTPESTPGELDAEGDVLDDIAQSLDETERTDEPVSEKLANIANKTWQHHLPDEQLKEQTGKYNRPSNCTKLVTVPKVNEEIWSKLPREPRGKDLKFSRLQTSIK